MKTGRQFGVLAHFDVERAEVDRAMLGFLLVGNNEAAEKLEAIHFGGDDTAEVLHVNAVRVLAGNIALQQSGEIPTFISNEWGTIGETNRINSFYSGEVMNTIATGTSLLIETPQMVSENASSTN